MTAWQPSAPLPWCAVCMAYYVREPQQYTCIVCEPRRPCPPRSVAVERLAKGAA